MGEGKFGLSDRKDELSLKYRVRVEETDAINSYVGRQDKITKLGQKIKLTYRRMIQ